MDERSSKRRRVDRPIRCWIADLAAQAYLYNLSQGGCLIEIRNSDLADALEPDTVIVIDLGEHGRQGGFVVWQREGCSGVRFAVELPEAAVAALGYVEPEFDIACAEPRDRFGRKLSPLAA